MLPLFPFALLFLMIKVTAGPVPLQDFLWNHKKIQHANGHVFNDEKNEWHQGVSSNPLVPPKAFVRECDSPNGGVHGQFCMNVKDPSQSHGFYHLAAKKDDKSFEENSHTIRYKGDTGVAIVHHGQDQIGHLIEVNVD